MRRRESFSLAWGTNWVVGRDLLPALRRLGAGECGDVLDLGCGESPFRDAFPRARHYTRVDRVALDPEVRLGDMLAIPAPDGDFDVVLVLQALTDVPRMDLALREIRRVLRPGGRLILFESMCYPEHDAPHDYYRLMPDGLRWLAVETAFVVEELTPLGGLFARFVSLWNSFLMGGIARWAPARPLAVIGISIGNLAARGLDLLLPHPRLAPDYLAVLKVPTDMRSGDGGEVDA